MNFFESIPMIYGGDYNPEQWPENTWQDDLDLLKQAGINTVTINVFSWSLLQPAELVYDFTKLDKIIKLLTQNKINIILATSTGATPAWISKKYPNTSRVDVNGVRQVQGKRHNACPNSKIFKRLVSGLVKKLVERYAGNPMLVAWHISNEYEGYCYCDQCKQAFREWLLNKYKSLVTLNEQWNSNFWSHTIHSWGEIEPPMKTTDLFENGKSVLSGLEIDYRRFQSDSLLNNYILEKNIIRQKDTEHPITTNFMGSKKDLDYFKWAPEIDIISWDNYPMPNSHASEVAMNHDLMRGLKQQPFMLMEQTPNQQNWYPFNKLKAPNEMRMLSYQAIAHGANSINFFQLKQSRSGAEKFHGSVLTLGATDNSRIYQEVRRLGKEINALPLALRNAKRSAKVAIIFDWESYWGVENSIGPIVDISYVEELQKFYHVFYKKNVNVDIISKSQSLDGYEIVVAPILYMWDKKLIANITEYVNGGGQFLTTYLSGIADETDRLFIDGALSPLRKLLGIRVDERDARSEHEAITIIGANNQIIGQATGVCDLIIPETAMAIAHYDKSVFYANYAAITVNQYGKGQGYYCGAGLDDRGLTTLIDELIGKTKIETINHHDIEITFCTTQKGWFAYIINTSNMVQSVNNKNIRGIDILSGKQIDGEVNLEAYEVMIIKSYGLNNGGIDK